MSDIIFKVPVMTYEKFAEELGMSERFVRMHMTKGDIPMTYEGLVNVAALISKASNCKGAECQTLFSKLARKFRG